MTQLIEPMQRPQKPSQTDGKTPASAELVRRRRASLLDHVIACFGESEEMRELRALRKTNHQIEKQLRKEKSEFRATLRLLLLGPGESGKSTFVKQMRLLQIDEFSEKYVLRANKNKQTNALTS